MTHKRVPALLATVREEWESFLSLGPDRLRALAPAKTSNNHQNLIVFLIPTSLVYTRHKVLCVYI